MEVRLFYAGMWCQADKAGRLRDDPMLLKAQIFPYDKVDSEKCLKALAQSKPTSKRPFIVRYCANGQSYIQILSWSEHQKPHHTEVDSKIPPHPPIKGMEKGMENQLEASAPLDNGVVTVKSTKPAFSEEETAFESARMLYPGTKRGHTTEWDNFKRKHKDHTIVAPDLVFAVQIQIAERKNKAQKHEFVPPWKHFQTWINNRWWETAEYAEV